MTSRALAVAETVPPGSGEAEESSKEPPSQSLVGRKIGRYIVDRLLGKGGMATVWRAVHEDLGGEVAIKILAPEAVRGEKELERFFQEAKVSAQLNHDHVVKVIDFARDPELGSYIVMELLNGRGLDRLLSAEGPLDEERAVSLALQITDALAVAHAHGIVHRDLKPANIFVTRTLGTEVIKVVDFGIAKLPSSRAMALTRPGEIYGTPLYMSPEQWDNGPITEASDIYSLGVVLYEMLAGKPPHNGSALTQLVVSVALSDPQPLSNHRCAISPELDAIVQRCLKKKPSDRFPTMRDLRDALERTRGTRFDITQTIRPGTSRESLPSVPSAPGAVSSPVRRSAPSIPAAESIPPSVPTSLPNEPLPKRRTLLAFLVMLALAGAALGVIFVRGGFRFPFATRPVTISEPVATPTPESAPAASAAPVSSDAVSSVASSPTAHATSSSSAVPARALPSASAAKRARPAPVLPRTREPIRARGAPSSSPEDDLLRKD
jgi:serine/threonine-protein kinase